MTALRQMMQDALEVRGMAPRTQDAYLGAVGLLARYYKRSPDTLSAAQVQGYLLHLRRERGRSVATLNQYGCAFRFLFGTVLGLDGTQFQIPLAAVPQRLPQILSRREISQLFEVTQHESARTFLKLAYATGLRLSELCHLRVADIDSQDDRMCIRVQQGKGGKDRYVPMAQDVLDLLRQHWRLAGLTRQHPWLFPSPENASRPISAGTPQKWYHAARAAAAISKQGGIHTLRHCYATHTLEAGVDVYTLSRWLGHGHVSTTSRYLHLVRPDVPDGAKRAPLALLTALPLLTKHDPGDQAPVPASGPASGPA